MTLARTPLNSTQQRTEYLEPVVLISPRFPRGAGNVPWLEPGHPGGQELLADRSLNNSLFVLGTGRSGTTIVFRMLASHPDFGWFSNYEERYPRVPQFALASRLLEPLCHGGGRSGLAKALPVPKEALGIPRVMTEGWFVRHDMIAPGETPGKFIDRYRQRIMATLRWQGKSRLLHKHTGFARVAFLNEVDPTGQFLHVIRDGRAVVDSFLRVPWWSGTLDSWWWGAMPDAYADEFRRSGEEPAVLAALVWLRLTTLIEEELATLDDDRVMALRYDHFVASPEETLASVCRYAGLEWSNGFRSRLNRFKLRDGDNGWQRRLSRQQIAAVERLLGDRLAAYGFSV